MRAGLNGRQEGAGDRGASSGLGLAEFGGLGDLMICWTPREVPNLFCSCCWLKLRASRSLSFVSYGIATRCSCRLARRRHGPG